MMAHNSRFQNTKVFVVWSIFELHNFTWGIHLSLSDLYLDFLFLPFSIFVFLWFRRSMKQIFFRVKFLFNYYGRTKHVMYVSDKAKHFHINNLLFDQ